MMIGEVRKCNGKGTGGDGDGKRYHHANRLLSPNPNVAHQSIVPHIAAHIPHTNLY